LLNYYIGIFKKLTVAKSFNFFKLALGFHLSRILQRPLQLGLPMFVSIEPTTSCNLRCPQCPSGLREFTRETGMLKPALFEKVICQLEKQLHSLTFYFQGEPYLNPHFLEMVKVASAKNIYTITSTNAHYLTEENCRKTVESKLDKLIISLDGLNQEVYEKYRVGGTIDKVFEGTKEILKQKKLLNSNTPHVIWQFVVFKQNESQIKTIKKLGKEFGVDEVKIKTAQIYDFENGHDLIPDAQEFSRYKKDSNGKYIIKNKLLNQCWRMWQGCVITWDGKVVPCCFDKDAKHQLGNLETDKFETLWYSEAYNKFRGAVLNSRQKIDICTNCTEGTKVWS
jgi:radical SAM protein with 4Fe4S-binding SPASM domain